MDGKNYDVGEAAALMILHSELKKCYKLADFTGKTKCTTKESKKYFSLLRETITNAMATVLIIASHVKGSE